MNEHNTDSSIRDLNDELASGAQNGGCINLHAYEDGSNASFLYDEKSGSIKAFSHDQELAADNTLRGFWEYSQGLDKELVRGVLGTRYRVFGEWLIGTVMVYPKECYNKFYCFDVFDMVENKYLPQEDVHRIAARLSIPCVSPSFDGGDFISWNA